MQGDKKYALGEESCGRSGETRFKDVADGLKRELEKRQRFIEKTLKLATTAYGTKVETRGRMPQHPPVSASGSKDVATTSSTEVSSGKGSIIDDVVAKAIKSQEWPLARVMEVFLLDTLLKTGLSCRGVWFPALICTGNQVAKVGGVCFIWVEYPEL